METGVYLIKNNVNGKIYIGSTATSFNNRFKQHLRLLKKNKHHSIYLQRAWNKYLEYNFEFIILEKCVKKDCIKREQFFIDTLKPNYNICKIAGSVLGIKVNSSNEIKIKQKERAKKLGLSHKGKVQPEHIVNHLRLVAKKTPIIAIKLSDNSKIYFDSIADAQRKLNIDKRYISAICRNKFKTIKGWSFQYV